MESEKVKEIKKALECCANWNGQSSCKDCPIGIEKCYKDENLMPRLALTLINELEECSKKWQKLCADEVALNKTLRDKINELEEGIAKSMLGCEFLPECTKEIAEKIWNMSKITVDATKHIVQGREYLHLDALKEIIKSCGVEIKE